MGVMFGNHFQALPNRFIAPTWLISGALDSAMPFQPLPAGLEELTV
jgi:hypothetical protein